jgi:hypothetical protein
MKTPRDILFARHQAAEPKLDAIRRKALAGLNRRDAKTPNLVSVLASWCLGGSKQLWLELVWPSRRIWSALAAIWILIFVLDFSQRDGSQTMSVKSSAPEMMMTFRDQQKLLNELLADRVLPVDAERTRTFSPKPRTEAVKLETV